MGRKILLFVSTMIIRFLTCTEVLGGLEHIPKEGAAIIVVNHLGRLEVPLIFTLAKREDLTGWVADKYRKIPLMPLIIHWLDAIWLDREGSDISALKHAQAYLQEGHMLGIAPEGTRSPTGALIEGKKGVAYLAAKTGVPIIPGAVTGTEKMNREWLRMRRPSLTVRFGAPFTLPEMKRNSRDELLQQGTDEIMCRIAALLPSEYRGVYSNHPRLKALLAMDAN